MLHGSLTVLIYTILFNIVYIHSYNASDKCELPNGKFVTIEQFLEKLNSQAVGSFKTLLDSTKVYERNLTELLDFPNQNGNETSMELYKNATAISETRPLDIDALLTLARNITPDVNPCDLFTLIHDSYYLYIFDLRHEKCELPNNKSVTVGQFLNKWNSEADGSVMSLLNWTKVYERYQTEIMQFVFQNGFNKAVELYKNATKIAETRPLDADALLMLAQNVKPDITPCDLLTLITDSYLSSLHIQNGTTYNNCTFFMKKVCELPSGKCVKVGQLLEKWNTQTYIGSVMSLLNWTKVDDQYHTEVRDYYKQNGFEKFMDLLTSANMVAGIRPLDIDALLTLARNIKPDFTICNLLALIDDSYFDMFDLQHDCNFGKESG